jgi:putative ABC transport system permease protein
MVSVRTKMLGRDLWRLRGQVIAAALVVACGIAVLVGMQGAWQSLAIAQERYYASHRFADVFANVKRAPGGVADQIRALSGVRGVETRIVRDVTGDVPGFSEPATLRLVSLPATGVPVANALFLLYGNYPSPAREGEVVASAAFAAANGLEVGSRVTAILNGRERQLEVVGIGISPEYVYEVGPGMVFPDNRRFGVLWMGRDAIASAFGMEGAFNDVALTLDVGADARQVIGPLDRLLARYGSLGAYGREDQLSHRFLTDELAEIGITATYVPAMFLAVSSFLLYALLSRLVTVQRAEIGLLKAFGYAGRTVALQYLRFGLVTVGVGIAAGIPGGFYLAQLMVALYRQYFHFPQLQAELSPRALVLAVLASTAAATVGAGASVWRATRLPPAEAMRPELPEGFRAGLLDRIGLLRAMPIPLRLILRNLARRPGKAALSMMGIALAVGLMVVGRFGLDGVNQILALQFGRAQHDDVTLIFTDPQPAAAVFDVVQLPGILRAESFRVAPVWLRHGHRAKRVELTGLDADSDLHEVVGHTMGRQQVSADGVVISARLAAALHLQVGDRVEVALLEGRRNVFTLPVTATVDDLLGLGAYVERQALSRHLGESPAISGVHLRIDTRMAEPLYRRLKRLPAISSVIVRSAVLESIGNTLDRTFVISSLVLAGFASVIVAGVVYNNIRIALSERGNELASLRVLGFSLGEVATILIGEQALLTAAALPFGIAVGYGLCALLVPVFDRDAFRIPLVLERTTLIFAMVPAACAALVAGLLALRRLQHLDLVAVLKTRE